MKGKIDRMDDQKQLEDRWRELDELLGLGPVAAAPIPKAETPPEPPPAPIVRETPPASEHQPRIEEEKPPVEPETPLQARAEWEAEFDEDADTEIMEQELPGSVPSEEAEETTEDADSADGPGAPAGEEEDKPRRGRRRRRRGRRKGGPEQGEGSAPPGSAAQPQDRAAPRERTAERGRRGRPREDEEPRPPRAAPLRQESEPAEAEDFHDEEPPVTRTPLAVDDTDFSDWNVPSWQDLISSLYRPDR